MELRDRLAEVESQGAPAQSSRATELLSRIAADPNDQSAQLEASVLIDAYLHDPYLTKKVGE